MLAQVLTMLGVSVALVTGWPGAELVDRLGIDIDQAAHVHASNSLSGRPAVEGRTGIS